MDKKYYCRECKRKTNHKSLHKENKIINTEYFYSTESFSIIQCLGCDSMSFLNIYSDDSMITEAEHGVPYYYEEEVIFPKYIAGGIEIITMTHYLPKKVRNIYQETVEALKNDLYILAAGGLRTIIEAICNELKIKKENISKRIDELLNEGYLTKAQVKRLHSVRFLGNDALHEVDTPEKEVVYGLFDIINHLLQDLFLQDKKIQNNKYKVIDNYIDFKKILISQIRKNIIDKEDMIGKEDELKNILNNYNKLIEKESLGDFIQKLNEEIKDGKIEFLEIVDESTNKYKIIKEVDPFL